MDKGEADGLVRTVCEARYADQHSSLIPGLELLRVGAPLTCISTVDADGGALIRVDIGLATDIPDSSSFLEGVNSLNRMLMFGRVFASQSDVNGTWIVAHQEFIPTIGISWDFEPSIGQYLSLLGGLLGMAEQMSSTIRSTWGGRPLNDDEQLVLFSVCDG